MGVPTETDGFRTGVSASRPRRPFDAFNASRIGTVVVVALTSDLALAEAPGNVRLGRRATGLSKASVANFSQVLTLDGSLLERAFRTIPETTMAAVDDGLRLALGL